LKRTKQLDTKQIPNREMERPKPVKCVQFELIFFLNRDKLFKKGNLNVIEEKANHGC